MSLFLIAPSLYCESSRSDTVIYLLAYEIPVFIISVFAFGYEDYELKPVLVSLAAMLMMVLSMSTVLSFVIGNLIMGGKRIVIILMIQYAMNSATVFGFFGEKFKIFDILTRIIPQGYTFFFSYSSISENIHLNIIFSVVLICIFAISGTAYFNKSDIK